MRRNQRFICIWYWSPWLGLRFGSWCLVLYIHRFWLKEHCRTHYGYAAGSWVARLGPVQVSYHGRRMVDDLRGTV